MSPTDENFVQVMATILVGTFIAYAIDLRDERTAPQISQLPRPLRGMVSFFVWADRLIPVWVTIALIVVILSVIGGELSFGAKLLVVIAGCASVSALGSNAVINRILGSPQRPG
jgi:hypothetical protein